MQRFLTWLRTMFKPKKCPKCGYNNFAIKETIRYNGHIDANTRRILCDNVQSSVIEEAVCSHCGYVPERAEFGVSELAEIV